MKRALAVLPLLLLAGTARADEGMWTFNGFPSAQVEEQYGFGPTREWLDHVRLASLRLANGCSASYVSPDGLVMTNHHCAHGCIADLSTAKKDYIADGFYAKRARDELQCPGMEINQLQEITDVTDRIEAAVRGKKGEAYGEALKAERSRIEGECATDAKVRCEVVSLYNGGRYDLYRYRRIQDVRLVWAPELGIANFGGDPDNFNFPRHSIDATLLRAYENGRPVKTDNWFAWSKAGADEGELVFVTGNPGTTSRLLTVGQLAFERDHVIPEYLVHLSELRGRLIEFMKLGPEQQRIGDPLLQGVENGLKAMRGRRLALVDQTFFGGLEEKEARLRKAVAADPKLKAEVGDAWGELERAHEGLWPLYRRWVMLEGNRRGARGFASDHFSFARRLVRAADELPKPSAERLPEYNDANLPAVQARLLADYPVYPEVEILTLSFSLTKLREHLGADDALVRQVLSKETPEQVAARLVKGSRLADPAYRKQLWEGGQEAVEASDDPMIAFARAVDPAAREVRRLYEERVEAVEASAGRRIASARFAVLGTGTYPDATFSPRLSYGAVKGWQENGHWVHPFTTFQSTYDRHTGTDPFELPKSWLQAKDRVDPSTPMNLVSTNDIIGGNSGSPLINRQAEVVGLVFDGNIQSLAGEYGFDERNNRTVSVHSSAILEALEKVYRATRLVEELRPAPEVRRN